MKVFFYDDRYLKQLVVFLRRVWNPEMTEDILKAKKEKDMVENPYAKIGGFPVAVAVKDDQIIGHHAGTPVMIWAKGKEVLSYWLAGLHVLPEGRRQGIAKALQNVTNQLPLATSFWVVEATLRVKKRMGWTVVGKIPDYIKILDPQALTDSVDLQKFEGLRPKFRYLAHAFFKNKKGYPIRLLHFLARAHNSFIAKRISKRISIARIDTVTQFDDRLDQLWECNKKFLSYAQVRKSAYLNWRFKHETGWIKLEAVKDDVVAGYAIISQKEIKKENYLHGLTVLSIIDIFWDFDNPDIFLDLLEYAEELGRRNNAAALVCSINHRAARSLLRKSGYWRIFDTVYFGFHCNDNSLILSPKLKDWYITRGDADASGSLGL